MQETSNGELGFAVFAFVPPHNLPCRLRDVWPWLLAQQLRAAGLGLDFEGGMAGSGTRQLRSPEPTLPFARWTDD